MGSHGKDQGQEDELHITNRGGLWVGTSIGWMGLGGLNASWWVPERCSGWGPGSAWAPSPFTPGNSGWQHALSAQTPCRSQHCCWTAELAENPPIRRTGWHLVDSIKKMCFLETEPMHLWPHSSQDNAGNACHYQHLLSPTHFPPHNQSKDFSNQAESH